jgi:hypothetical protein
MEKPRGGRCIDAPSNDNRRQFVAELMGEGVRGG